MQGIRDCCQRVVVLINNAPVHLCNLDRIIIHLGIGRYAGIAAGIGHAADGLPVDQAFGLIAVCRRRRAIGYFFIRSRVHRRDGHRPFGDGSRGFVLAVFVIQHIAGGQIVAQGDGQVADRVAVTRVRTVIGAAGDGEVGCRICHYQGPIRRLKAVNGNAGQDILTRVNIRGAVINALVNLDAADDELISRPLSHGQIAGCGVEFIVSRRQTGGHRRDAVGALWEIGDRRIVCRNRQAAAGVSHRRIFSNHAAIFFVLEALHLIVELGDWIAVGDSLTCLCRLAEPGGNGELGRLDGQFTGLEIQFIIIGTQVARLNGNLITVGPHFPLAGNPAVIRAVKGRRPVDAVPRVVTGYKVIIRDRVCGSRIAVGDLFVLRLYGQGLFGDLAVEVKGFRHHLIVAALRSREGQAAQGDRPAPRVFLIVYGAVAQAHGTLIAGHDAGFGLSNNRRKLIVLPDLLRAGSDRRIPVILLGDGRRVVIRSEANRHGSFLDRQRLVGSGHILHHFNRMVVVASGDYHASQIQLDVVGIHRRGAAVSECALGFSGPVNRIGDALQSGKRTFRAFSVLQPELHFKVHGSRAVNRFLLLRYGGDDGSGDLAGNIQCAALQRVVGVRQGHARHVDRIVAAHSRLVVCDRVAFQFYRIALQHAGFIFAAGHRVKPHIVHDVRVDASGAVIGLHICAGGGGLYRAGLDGQRDLWRSDLVISGHIGAVCIADHHIDGSDQVAAGVLARPAGFGGQGMAHGKGASRDASIGGVHRQSMLQAVINHHHLAHRHHSDGTSVDIVFGGAAHRDVVRFPGAAAHYQLGYGVIIRAHIGLLAGDRKGQVAPLVLRDLIPVGDRRLGRAGRAVVNQGDGRTCRVPGPADGQLQRRDVTGELDGVGGGELVVEVFCGVPRQTQLQVAQRDGVCPGDMLVVEPCVGVNDVGVVITREQAVNGIDALLTHQLAQIGIHFLYGALHRVAAVVGLGIDRRARTERHRLRGDIDLCGAGDIGVVAVQRSHIVVHGMGNAAAVFHIDVRIAGLHQSSLCLIISLGQLGCGIVDLVLLSPLRLVHSDVKRMRIFVIDAFIVHRGNGDRLFAHCQRMGVGGINLHLVVVPAAHRDLAGQLVAAGVPAGGDQIGGGCSTFNDGVIFIPLIGLDIAGRTLRKYRRNRHRVFGVLGVAEFQIVLASDHQRGHIHSGGAEDRHIVRAGIGLNGHGGRAANLGLAVPLRFQGAFPVQHVLRPIPAREAVAPEHIRGQPDSLAGGIRPGARQGGGRRRSAGSKGGQRDGDRSTGIVVLQLCAGPRRVGARHIQFRLASLVNQAAVVKAIPGHGERCDLTVHILRNVK